MFAKLGAKIHKKFECYKCLGIKKHIVMHEKTGLLICPFTSKIYPFEQKSFKLHRSFIPR